MLIHFRSPEPRPPPWRCWSFGSRKRRRRRSVQRWPLPSKVALRRINRTFFSNRTEDGIKIRNWFMTLTRCKTFSFLSPEIHRINADDSGSDRALSVTKRRRALADKWESSSTTELGLDCRCSRQYNAVVKWPPASSGRGGFPCLGIVRSGHVCYLLPLWLPPDAKGMLNHRQRSYF